MKKSDFRIIFFSIFAGLECNKGYFCYEEIFSNKYERI